MKKTTSIIFSFFIFYFSNGQNLVPNWSFEDSARCPNQATNLIDLAPPWFIPNISSPDYFYLCMGGGIPDNIFGQQIPKTGNAYGGIGMYDPSASEYREYIEVKLQSILKYGKKYCVSFYVSLAGNSVYAIDDIGLFFSNDSIKALTIGPLNLTPQIRNSEGNFLTDTLNWVLISGIYTSFGSEKFIIIGNFLSNAQTSIMSAGSGIYPMAYYYVDDVSIFEQKNADAGKDTVTCPGEYVLIGTPPALGLKYSWSPSEELLDTTTAQTFANPKVTTTYYLTITDTLGNNCVGKGTDTVTVYVYTPVAKAGKDTVICRGKSLTIGLPAVNGFSYQWQPSEGLSNPFSAQPTATPEKTTTYILTVTDTAGIHKCINKDTVSIFVEECAVIVPSVLYRDDRLIIKNLAEKSGLKIYNSLGQLIFTKESYLDEFASWMVSEGTYYYELNLPDSFKKKGKVLVIK